MELEEFEERERERTISNQVAWVGRKLEELLLTQVETQEIRIV